MRAHMIGPVLKRPSSCPAAVRFFDARADITEPYLEVARLEPWWPPDGIAYVRTVEDAERNKAAKLGANGVIRGRVLGGDSINTRYEDKLSGIAIFIPTDSVQAVNACASIRPAQ